MQNRLRSKVLWAAILGQVLSILQLSGALKSWGVDVGTAGDVLAGVLQLLVLFGVLNNPTDKENF